MMRVIDYWVGIPLCFLLSVFNRIFKILGLARRGGGSHKKILFIKLSEMGAVVVAYPLLKKMKNDYRGSELFFLVFRKNKPVFDVLGGIVPDKNIFTIRDNSFILFVFDTIKAIASLRRLKIDIAFDLEFFSRFSVILAYLIGARKRAGFYRYHYEGLYRGDLLTHKVQYNPLIHTARSYLSLEQMISEDTRNSPEMMRRDDDSDLVLPRYVSDPAARGRVKAMLTEHGIGAGSRLILMNPGEGILPIREWDLEEFVLLSGDILKDGDSHIVIVGTESEKAGLLKQRLDERRCTNLVGKTTVRDLLELFCISSALIANDCGLAHLASLTPIKKFIIFGPETPVVFGPLGENSRTFFSNLPCSPCLTVFNYRSSPCRCSWCLKMIRHEDVYKLIKETI